MKDNSPHATGKIEQNTVLKWRSYVEGWRDYLRDEWGVEPREFRNLVLSVVAFLSTAIPLVLVIAYASSHQMAAFDVLDTLGAHIITLVAVSFLMTLLTATTMTMPGLVRLAQVFAGEEQTSNRCNECGTILPTQSEKEAEQKTETCSSCGADKAIITIEPWQTRYARFVTFVPGSLLVTITLLVQLFSHDDPLDRITLWGFVAGLFPLLIGAFYLACHLWALKRTKLGLFSALKEVYFPLPQLSIAIYLIDALLITVWLQIIGKIIIAKFGDVPLGDDFLAWKYFGVSFLWAFVASALLFFSGIWADRKKYIHGVGAVAIAFMLLITILPGPVSLLKNHLAIMSQGGGIPVVLTTDRGLVSEWPILFEYVDVNGVKTNSGGHPRTRVLKLELLGDDRAFIRFPEIDLDRNYIENQLEIPRDRIKSILFLGKAVKDESKKNEKE